MQKTIIETQNLSIGYKLKGSSKIIQQNVNLKLRSGSLISVLGINGIGKSTLLKTLCGIQQALSGTILVQGKELSRYNQINLAQLISVVFTDKLPPNKLKVRELIALGRTPYTNWFGQQTLHDNQKIDAAIAICELEDFKNDLASSLSDGQMQRVLIARAIAQDTPVIILDEPSIHLDLYHKIALFRLLKKLCVTQNKCVLLATHDMDLALQMSNEIIALKSNFSIQDTVEELLKKAVFTTFFKDESIVFNPEECRFKIHSL